MRKRPLLYFAFGILFTISIFAMTIRSDGIQFPDGSVLTTAENRKLFYLTNSSFWVGNNAPVACDTDAGFHMASLWEILDVTQLRYATNEDLSEGYAVFSPDDGSQGPPVDTGSARGWIKNGAGPFGLVSQDYPAGLVNCLAQTTNQGTYEGTLVSLSFCWGTVCDPPRGSIGGSGWVASKAICSAGHSVWCVQD